MTVQVKVNLSFHIEFNLVNLCHWPIQCQSLMEKNLQVDAAITLDINFVAPSNFTLSCSVLGFKIQTQV